MVTFSESLPSLSSIWSVLLPEARSFTVSMRASLKSSVTEILPISTFTTSQWSSSLLLCPERTTALFRWPVISWSVLNKENRECNKPFTWAIFKMNKSSSKNCYSTDSRDEWVTSDLTWQFDIWLLVMREWSIHTAYLLAMFWYLSVKGWISFIWHCHSISRR